MLKQIFHHLQHLFLTTWKTILSFPGWLQFVCILLAVVLPVGAVVTYNVLRVNGPTACVTCADKQAGDDTSAKDGDSSSTNEEQTDEDKKEDGSPAGETSKKKAQGNKKNSNGTSDAAGTSGSSGSSGSSSDDSPPSISGRTWPTASSTGATGSLTTASGDVELDTEGALYQNIRLTGSITVTACGVTIRNVEVLAQNQTFDDFFAIWLKHDEFCAQPVIIDRVSVIADGFVTTAVRNAFGGPASVLSSKFVGIQDGILGFGSGLIQDSYIELGMSMNGEHNDGIQIGGSNGLTIKHNTILNPNDQTSALALFTEFGPNQNMLVENNLIAGGGYACYCGDGVDAPSVNVDFIDNVFWKKYYSTVGAFGPGRAYNPNGGGVWSNNLYMEAGGTQLGAGLTSTLVEQPDVDQ